MMEEDKGNSKLDGATNILKVTLMFHHGVRKIRYLLSTLRKRSQNGAFINLSIKIIVFPVKLIKFQCKNSHPALLISTNVEMCCQVRRANTNPFE